jgi:hypothetical protein
MTNDDIPAALLPTKQIIGKLGYYYRDAPYGGNDPARVQDLMRELALRFVDPQRAPELR